MSPLPIFRGNMIRLYLGKTLVTEIVPTIFPDGTSQVWKLPHEASHPDIMVNWLYEKEAELIHLAQLKDLLNWHGCNPELVIEYLPYARQDKPVSNENTFALTSFCKIINGMNWRRITIGDPHSFIPQYLLTAPLIFKYPVNEVMSVARNNKIDFVIYPDEGARLRYSKIYEFLNLPHCSASKNRDAGTGVIYAITLPQLKMSLADKRILMIDDICDGGATFIQIAKILLTHRPKEISLFVTHGIFSKGVKVLHEAGIKNVFTANGKAEETREQQTVYIERGVYG